MLDGVEVSSESLSPEIAPNTVFDRFAAQGTLAYQKCPDCAAAIFPPRVLCPSCGSGILNWRTSSGRGSVYSLTELSPRNRPAYTVALIDLDEGFRMMSAPASGELTSIEIGDRIAVTFEDTGEFENRPVFTKEQSR